MIRNHVHTIPLDDSDWHNLTAACPCFPRLQVSDQGEEPPSLHIKHSAFDRREEGEAIGVGDSKGWINMNENGDTYEDHEEQSAARPMEDDDEA